MTTTFDGVATAPRWVELPGAHNVRDIGGLPGRDGCTRAGVLYRGDSLDHLTTYGARTLVDQLGVRTVMDLRVPRECTAMPAWWTASGPTRLSIPLLDEEALDSQRHRRNLTLGKLYRSYLASAGPVIAAIMQRLVAPDTRPALVHCAAGKDRTGVVVAVLLAAAGVHRDAIVADYAASDERIDQVLAAQATRGRYAGPTSVSGAFLRAPAAAMHGLLDDLEREYGSAADFLSRYGAPPSLVQRWTSVLVRPRQRR